MSGKNLLLGSLIAFSSIFVNLSFAEEEAYDNEYFVAQLKSQIQEEEDKVKKLRSLLDNYQKGLVDEKKIGALIVIQRATPLDDIVSTGEVINADINQRLIENIFFKNSPLHDGAVIIVKEHIKAAGCILPVSHDLDIPKELGLRHRAALGITQESDGIAVVVSEETGSISIAIRSKFHLRLSAEKLESILTSELA